MAIDFPSNPTNGQVYANYIYDSSITAWRNVNTDAGIGTLNAMGLKNVMPTSVVVGSGSATVNANGLVTFTAASSISLNNIFTSTYDTYDILIDITASSVNGYPALRGLTAGTDNSSSNYYSMYHFSRATGVGVDGVVNSTNWFFGNNYTTSPYYGVKATIQRPVPTVQKQGVFNSIACDSTSTFAFNGGLLFNATGVSFDGLTLYNNGGGTLSGTIRAYGYSS